MVTNKGLYGAELEGETKIFKTKMHQQEIMS